MKLDHLRPWVGRTETQRDVFTTRLAKELAALLDHQQAPKAGACVPPLWHWSLFPHIVSQSHLGPDGHPERGDFLPPVSLPRRLWGGSRLLFQRPLVIGREISRTSQIVDIGAKNGRRGQFVIVRVLHQLEDLNGLLLSEEQDIVYCDRVQASEPARDAPSSPPTSTWRQTVAPDPVLLFRYSAATFNAHRIHYDRHYAQTIEGYPALVVHGPLIATMLIDLVCRNLPAVPIADFMFKAVNPIFDDRPFHLCAQYAGGNASVRVWAQDFDGHLCVDGKITLAGGAMSHQ